VAVAGLDGARDGADPGCSPRVEGNVGVERGRYFSKLTAVGNENSDVLAVERSAGKF
jgi:hypothetical protein